MDCSVTSNFVYSGLSDSTCSAQEQTLVRANPDKEQEPVTGAGYRGISIDNPPVNQIQRDRMHSLGGKTGDYYINDYRKGGERECYWK